MAKIVQICRNMLLRLKMLHNLNSNNNYCEKLPNWSLSVIIHKHRLGGSPITHPLINNWEMPIFSLVTTTPDPNILVPLKYLISLRDTPVLSTNLGKLLRRYRHVILLVLSKFKDNYLHSTTVRCFFNNLLFIVKISAQISFSQFNLSLLVSSAKCYSLIYNSIIIEWCISEVLNLRNSMSLWSISAADTALNCTMKRPTTQSQ